MTVLPQCDYTVAKFTVDDKNNPEVTGTVIVNGVTIEFSWSEDLGMNLDPYNLELIITEDSEAYRDSEGRMVDVDAVADAEKAVDADLFATVCLAQKMAENAAWRVYQAVWSM